MNLNVQLVVLGMGDEKFVNLFNWAAHRYQGKVAAWNQMNHELAHRIYAGCDLFRMPSAFEPLRPVPDDCAALRHRADRPARPAA